MRKAQIFQTALSLTACLAGALFPLTASGETVLRAGGTGFGIGVLEVLADVYMKKHPDVRIKIVPSLGSSGGIKALNQGALDFALSGRHLNVDEKRLGGAAREICRSPFLLVTNGKAARNSISTAELENIYAARTSSWSNGARIRLVLRPETDTDTIILKGLSPAMEKAVKSAQSRDGMIMAITDQENANMLEKIPGAFGGIALTQLLSEKRQVNILSFNGVKPGLKTIADGSYPLVKALFLVTTPKTPPAARQFLDFIRSSEGRRILVKYGNLVVEGK